MGCNRSRMNSFILLFESAEHAQWCVRCTNNSAHRMLTNPWIEPKKTKNNNNNSEMLIFSTNHRRISHSQYWFCLLQNIYGSVFAYVLCHSIKSPMCLSHVIETGESSVHSRHTASRSTEVQNCKIDRVLCVEMNFGTLVAAIAGAATSTPHSHTLPIPVSTLVSI